MNNNTEEWDKIYKDVVGYSRSDYLDTIDAFKRIDEKIGRYLLIISIALVPNINIFIYLFTKIFVDEKLPLLAYIMTSIFIMLILFAVIAIIKCVHALEFTKTKRIFIDEYMYKYVSKNSTTNHTEFIGGLIYSHAEGIQFNLQSLSMKRDKLSCVSLLIRWMFSLMFIMIVFMIFIIFR